MRHLDRRTREGLLTERQRLLDKLYAMMLDHENEALSVRLHRKWERNFQKLMAIKAELDGRVDA